MGTFVIWYTLGLCPIKWTGADDMAFRECQALFASKMRTDEQMEEKYVWLLSRERVIALQTWRQVKLRHLSQLILPRKPQKPFKLAMVDLVAVRYKWRLARTVENRRI